MDGSSLRGPQRRFTVRLALGASLVLAGLAVVVGAAPVGAAPTVFLPPPLWHQVTPGPGGVAAAGTVVARDPASGALYVAGHAADRAGGSDVVVVKYGADGEQGWMRTFAGTKTAPAAAVGAAVDRDGDLIVLAQVGDRGTGLDWEVVKLSADGGQVWARTIAGAGSSPDRPGRLALERSGAVIAVGALGVAGRGLDAAVVRLAANGRVSWRRFVGGRAGRSDRFSSVGLDARGRVVAGGEVGAGQRADCLIAAYTGTGRRLWTRTWDGPAHGRDAVSDLVVASAGYAYVVGSYGSAAGSIAMIRKYDAAGRLAWQATYHTKSAGSAWFTGVAFMTGGRAVATGTIVTRATGDSDIVTTGFAAQGRALWQQIWTTPHGPGVVSPDRAADVAVDGAGRVFVAGTVGNGTRRSLDYALFRYTATGRAVWPWPRTWNGGAGDDVAGDLVLAPGGVVVTGRAATQAGRTAIGTVKFPY